MNEERKMVTHNGAAIIVELFKHHENLIELFVMMFNVINIVFLSTIKSSEWNILINDTTKVTNKRDKYTRCFCFAYVWF